MKQGRWSTAGQASWCIRYGHPRTQPRDGRRWQAGEAPELVYGTAEEFLHEQLLPTYVRSVSGKTAKWCIEWYFHPEPVSRIAALWRAWEHLGLDRPPG